MMRRNNDGDDGIIVEIIRRGRAVKVTAIDPVSGLEAVMVGDPTTSEAKLRRLVLKKL